ncbi:MAG: glucose-6-phosphate isomerase [Sulfurimonadaceae bacterium]|jgi:glucose-6-phosphate isomerase|nr:glucose-6-phosphate isomerase [Sulfurimonadaceae bacterium]
MKHTNSTNAAISVESVFNDILEEKVSQEIGYYELVNQDTTSFKEFAKTVKQKHIVVIGIGGSTLGTYAIYKFLKHSRKLTKNLFFLETTDPIDIKSKLDLIDINDTLFIVISKSGTTVETISIFKYLNSLVTCDKSNTVVITESDSKLNTYAKTHGMQSFEVPKNVGGRFSVFCAVGLVPLAIVGLDIDALLAGAKEVHDSFFDKKESYETIMKKGHFLVENKERYNINVVFTYSSRMEGFNKWYVQLWGESLGKIDKNQVSQGLTPIGITGPIDQHSFLQLIMEGKRDKTITVVKVKDFDNNVKIPNITLAGLEELDYLNGLEFSKLINMQADATIEAINDLVDVPCDVTVIDTIDEESIASLMYEYELLTSVTAKFMAINAYDQPGVESGKIILKNKLKG